MLDGCGLRSLLSKKPNTNHHDEIKGWSMLDKDFNHILSNGGGFKRMDHSAEKILGKPQASGGLFESKCIIWLKQCFAPLVICR